MTMVKTTVYLDIDLALRLRQLAAIQKRTKAGLIREVLGEYAKKAKRPMPKGVGAYSSGRNDVGERAEEILMQAVKEGRWP